MDLEEKYQLAIEAINGAGGLPIPPSDALTVLVKEIIAADEVEFILAFRDQKSQTMEQLLRSSGLPEADPKEGQVAGEEGGDLLSTQPQGGSGLSFVAAVRRGRV